MSSAAFAYPQKSAEAFRTISEVATELDVPQHVLRFWESRFAQIKPVKRAGGRRYYRPEDVDLLRGIRALLYTDGLTIRGVQKVLKERGLRHVAELGRGDTPPPQTLVIERPVVVEKIVYVEKPVAPPAKKPRPGASARRVRTCRCLSLTLADMARSAGTGACGGGDGADHRSGGDGRARTRHPHRRARAAGRSAGRTDGPESPSPGGPRTDKLAKIAGCRGRVRPL